MRNTKLCLMAGVMLMGSWAYGQASKVVAPEMIETISRQTVLRLVLPENTLAYVRVPSILGMISAPNNRQLDGFLASQKHQEFITALKKKLSEDATLAQLLPNADSHNQQGLSANALATLLLQVMDGPLEAVVTDQNNMLTPMSRIFATVPVKIDSIEAFNAFIAPYEQLGVTKLDAAGYGTLTNDIHYYFDRAKRRLFVYAGMNITRSALKNAIAALKPSPSHALYAQENAIDRSGQNFFAWVSLNNNGAALAGLLPKKQAWLRALLYQIQSLAFGAGTNEQGQGQWKVIVEAPMEKAYGLTLPKTQPMAFSALGVPHYALTLTLPNEQLVEQVVKLGLAAADNDLDVAAEYQKGRDHLFNALGFNPFEFLNVLGPEVVFYEDSAGQALAIKLQNRQKFDALIEGLTKKYNLNKTINGSLSHLVIPNGYVGQFLSALEMNLAHNPIVVRLLMNEFSAALYGIRLLDKNHHLYWQQEGEWLFVNSLPHTLLERKHAKTSMNDWLANQQYDVQQTLLGFTTVIKDAERVWYKRYLGFIRNLSDELALGFDITALPLMSAMHFKPESRLGFALNLDQTSFGATFSYDLSPSDAGIYGGMTNVAMVGILSMFALPAYQDYTVRTQVAEGLALATGVKMAVVEYYATQGSWPANNEAAGVAPAAMIRSAAVEAIEVKDNGVIVIHYTNKTDNKTVILQATSRPQSNAIQWRCTGGTMAAKYRPASCRK